MTSYVSDWSQEVYGDVRKYAVPAVPMSVRRDYLNDYLQHKLVLAGVGPPTIETARSYLRTAFSPLANAAWEQESGYGWTMVPAEQMAGYVSAQIHALRFFSTTSGQPQDHWGFAWAPRNTSGIPASDFAAQTGLVLDRLAAAVRESGQTLEPADPGSAACGPPGQNVWCAGDLEDARLTEAWKSFRGWTQSVLAFGTTAQTIRTGSPSAAMSLALVTSSGSAVTTPNPLAVTLSSSSPEGVFSTSPAGPWSSTLSLTLAAGSGASAGFSEAIAGDSRRACGHSPHGHGCSIRRSAGGSDARRRVRVRRYGVDGTCYRAGRRMRGIMEAVRRFEPGARFAVVAFRDPYYPAPEYEVLQPPHGGRGRRTGRLRPAEGGGHVGSAQHLFGGIQPRLSAERHRSIAGLAGRKQEGRRRIRRR
jgi:hypothetical protein